MAATIERLLRLELPLGFTSSTNTRKRKGLRLSYGQIGSRGLSLVVLRLSRLEQGDEQQQGEAQAEGLD
jgi:hypothetical protein